MFNTLSYQGNVNWSLWDSISCQSPRLGLRGWGKQNGWGFWWEETPTHWSGCDWPTTAEQQSPCDQAIPPRINTWSQQSQRHLHICVYCGNVPKSQDPEPAQVSRSMWVEKQNVLCVNNRVLFSYKDGNLLSPTNGHSWRSLYEPNICAPKTNIMFSLNCTS